MGMFGNGQMLVTINREELLERLRENRERHEKTYQLALASWREDLAALLKKLDVSEATEFPAKLNRMSGKCPKSHVKEYDRVIDMFEMSVSETIELDGSNFDKFCRDEWSWTHSAMSNSYYNNAFIETSSK